LLIAGSIVVIVAVTVKIEIHRRSEHRTIPAVKTFKIRKNF
jgi:hypothetical protein